MPPLDLIWTFTGLLLTLMIFSYIFGDNVLFRIAVYIFIGVTAGYVLVMIVDNVLFPQLIMPLITGSLLTRGLTLIPLILCLLLFTKLFPRISTIGRIPMAYLVGVAAAVAIGGAVLGTLFGQIGGTVNAFSLNGSTNPLGSLFGAVIVLIGAICTLAYFHFGASTRPNQPPRRAGGIEAFARVGQVFLAITLGALFAGVYAAAVSALIERLDAIKTFIMGFIGG